MPTSDDISLFKENTEELPDVPISVNEDSAPKRDLASIYLIRCIVCFDECFVFDRAYNLLSKACSIDDFQIAYSEIFKILYTTEKLEALVDDSLFHCKRLEDEFEDIESKRILLKITEYIKLSRLQINQMFELSGSINENNRRRIEDASRDTTRSIISQLIGVVSIFTALAFILFGGISGISSIKDLIVVGEKSVSTMLICFFLFGLIMFGCLILFVFFILQIINPSKSGFPLKKIALFVTVPFITTIVVLFIISKIPFVINRVFVYQT